MEPQIILWVLMVLALAAALVAGVFLTFSDFVMPSLFAAAPAAGTGVEKSPACPSCHPPSSDRRLT